MPGFVRSAIISLLPISFLLSCFEIVGLLIIVPVIQILIKPTLIQENQYINLLFELFQKPEEITFVIYLLLLIVLFFIGKNVITYWASFRQTRITYGVAEQLTSLQFQNYLYQPYSNHVKDNTSILLRKIIEIPYNFTNGIMLPVVQLINEIIVVVLIIAGILMYSSSLFISIVVFISPFFFVYSRVYRKRLRSVSSEREQGHSDMFRKGRQSIDGFREILLFDKFAYFEPTFNASVNRFAKAMARLYHLNLFSPKIIEMLAIICVLAIFVSGLMLKFNLTELVGFLAMFAIAAYRLIPSINKMILSYNNIRSSEFVFSHFQTVKWNQAIENNRAANLESLGFNHQITLSDISFSFYVGQNLLDHINLTIKKGEIIGIVGKSGSGKTTLINIMLGLLPPSTGRIEVDSVEITDETIKRWHKTISYVPQNPVLLEGTMTENIAFGIPMNRVNREQLDWAIENSGLKEFINTLPVKLDSQIGDKSLNISGGQKQRIAIARALYHNGKILIFDEATNSLDHETGNFLTESIKKLSSQGYTIVIIAHQKETLRYCDRIIKLKDGKLSDSVTVNEVI